MLLEKVKEEIKQAMKDKDTLKKNALKNVMNKAQTIAKDRYAESVVLDEDVMTAIKKELKQLDDTIGLVGDSTDLGKQSIQMKEILVKYLPEQMGEEELTSKIVNLAKEIEDETGIKANKGSLMKKTMAMYKDKADGKMINVTVDKVLKSL